MRYKNMALFLAVFDNLALYRSLLLTELIRYLNLSDRVDLR